MTGYFYENKNEHTRVIFYFEKNNKKFKLYFNDQRNFGTIMIDTHENLNRKLSKLGFDFLNEKIKYNDFIELLMKYKEKIIAVVLLDQKVFSGIGNYLRSEILYDAKINPFIKIKNMDEKQLLKLFKSIKKVMKFSYEQQYESNFIKESEYFDNNFFKVYEQKFDPKGNPVLKKKINDRTIWYIKN